MPELPEVETFVRRFRPLVKGRRITAFTSRWPKQASPSVAKVRRAIVGRTVRRLDRRGKYLVFQLDPPGFLLVHLGMSGRLEWSADYKGTHRSRSGLGYSEPPHVRSVWAFDDGNRLLFCDPRKFGRIRYADDLAAATARLGIEPLSRRFTATALEKLLRGRARQLKPLLLDQSMIAGLGNIYSDEALFRAGLHPLTPSNRLHKRQTAALRDAIRSVLHEAIRCHGTSFDWIYPGGWMQRRLCVYGRTGEPCRRCGTPIKRLRVAQRGTHICPSCQPLDGER